MDDILDIDLLTAPIDDGGSGVGEDLRQAVDAADFYALKDLRAAARTAEREASSAAESDTPVLQAGMRSWGELSGLAQTVLARRSKDLEVAGWLCEAQVRLGGFVGLAQGLALVLRLLQLYWEDGVFPSADEEGVETRLAPIAGLLGLSGAAALAHPLRLIPISDRNPEVALWSLEAATAPIQGADDPDARERATARRAERLDQVRSAVARSSPAFLRANHAAVVSALGTVESLVDAVSHLGDTGRFGVQVVDPLRAIATFFEEQAGHLFGDAPARGGAPEADEGPQDADDAPGGAPGAGRRIRGRDEAFDAVLRIADWFAGAEPQSVVARSLREVVRRARLPLDDLLRELLPEPEQRTLFMQRAGVKLEPDPQVNDSF